VDKAPVRFGELAIQGFRRLRDVRLELKPLSVMIGANGTGKTSVLDVLALLASSAQGNLRSGISDLSGLTSILSWGVAEELRLGITTPRPSGIPLEYELVLRPQGTGYMIREETLRMLPEFYIGSNESEIKYWDPDKRAFLSPTWDYNPLETSLSQVPKMFREPEDFRSHLASSTFYHSLNVEPRSAVRLPRPMRPADLPGRNGEDLVACLYYLRETDRYRFEAIEDSLKAAFSGFERLEFRGNVGTGMARARAVKADVCAPVVGRNGAVSVVNRSSSKLWTHASHASR
jgi:predicted ATPase